MDIKLNSKKTKIKKNINIQNVKNNIDKDKKIVVVQKKFKKKGNYILGETIGEGAFAKVKLAKHIYTGEKVAIKILNKEKINKKDDCSNIKKIKKEISILQRLRHKNVIQLYEIMETNKSLYIVMEYCEGKELFDYISKRKHLTEREACRYFQQIINGVEYLHLSYVTHRDLKPENLLLDNKKRILISDFGLSILSKDYNNLLSTPCGTPSYAPPEMLVGKKYNGVYSDIWSCGIILYTMLAGNLPCSDSKENLVYQNMITHNFLYPENLSDDAIDLMEHLLKINPEERYNFDEIKAHPWFNLLNPKLRPGIIYDIHKIPIDNRILEKVEELGYDKKKVEESVINYNYDSFSAVYYLILKQFKKDGINSISDLFSEDYLNYLKDYKNWINPSKINDPLFKDYEVELLDNFYEDELLWMPNVDSPNDFSKFFPEEENDKKKQINFKENEYNDIFKDNLSNNIFEDKEFQNDIEENIKNDSLINNMDINFNNNNIENKIKISRKKILKTPNKLYDNIKKTENSRNKQLNLKRKTTNDIQSTNSKNSQNIKFNLKNLPSKKLVEKNSYTQRNIKKSNPINNNSNSLKNMPIFSPNLSKTSKTIKNKSKFNLCDKIIFDNLNVLDAESKVLSQNSEIFSDSEKKLILSFKDEGNKQKTNKNKPKIEFSPLKTTNIISLTNKRNKKNDLIDLISEKTNIREKQFKENNYENYKIRIKRNKKKEEEKITLLTEELEQNKKEEIINKLKEEEKKFNEELNLIDNISMFNSNNFNTINNNKDKSIVQNIAEKLIKETIFWKYLIGSKKPKSPLKVDLEDKFYILQKYKNIIGMIEKMRNKVFPQKVNDFNFYTFNEYLNDKNDNIYAESLLKIPYFNSFIQKAKNISYLKETMFKRAYSKNYVLKSHSFNINNNILTSHLSSNSNNLFHQNSKKNYRLNNVKNFYLNSLFTYDKNKKFINYNTCKTETNDLGKNYFYLHKKSKNATMAETPYFNNKIKIERNKTFSANRNNLKKVSNSKSLKNTYNNKSVGRVNKYNYNNNNLTSYNNKRNNNKKFMKDIVENEESISSFSSFDVDKNNLNILIQSKNDNIDNNECLYQMKTKNNLEDEKMGFPGYNNIVNNDNNELNNNQVKINVKILKNKKEDRENSNKNKDKGNEDININSKKDNNNESLKELKEFIPIDLNNIVNLQINNIIQQVKKYLKISGYFCKDKGNVIKGNKGSSIIEITLYKLNYLTNDNTYLSVKIKSNNLKKEKLFVMDMIYYLKK